VTAIELLPIHAFVDDKRLVENGLRNYWGYNSIGSLRARHALQRERHAGEFKTMVKTLHAAGIEVILDVVYNHTGEGNHLGPTLSFRGIDNRVYYRLQEDPRFYTDYTGTGNTLSTLHPAVLRLIFDSLRYWVQEMHVDGFRFDLAVTMAREQHAFDPFGSFCDIVRQDPVLSQVKLIAEPWDIGEGGYQVGRLSPRLVGVERALSRRRALVLEGRRRPRGELASRLSGSSDIFAQGRTSAQRQHQLRDRARRLHATRSDELQRQAQRSQRSRTTATANRTTAAGTAASKGPTDDPAIRALRMRRCAIPGDAVLSRRAFPMLLGGDEIGRTQQGQQQRVLPGQRDLVVRLDARRASAARCSRSRARDRACATASAVPPPHVLPRPARCTIGPKGHRLAQSRTAAR
jgi:glycogen operon protein